MHETPPAPSPPSPSPSPTIPTDSVPTGSVPNRPHRHHRRRPRHPHLQSLPSTGQLSTAGSPSRSPPSDLLSYICHLFSWEFG
ncbi:hypothetical protein QJS10_CPB20g00807 [Acorus calamus]|uniref:Uncharacterized protein n=1 Tax=Acorus calamus TaxID=4465 RepID=A0AAV9CBR9_ACOCL|nr:hypothetical protein QJS10_CPB20g00807 [Acorus calamus]